MSYDEALAERLRDEMLGEVGVTERRMFGGLAFMIEGTMAVAAGSGGELMVRADPSMVLVWRDEEGVRPMEMRGRALKGWLLVAPDVLLDDDTLRLWVERGVGYARSLPQT